MKRNKLIMGGIVVFIFIILSPYIFNVFYNLLAWHLDDNWKRRRYTSTIENSRQKGVFVKELDYKITDSGGLNFTDFHFKPYIEKGYKLGKHDANEIHLLKNSKYPYNLRYEKSSDSIFLSPDLRYVDSTDGDRGYLSQPHLKDTIIFDLWGTGHSNKKGTMKVW